MKVDEFKQKLIDMKAVFDELDNEIDVVWFPIPNAMTWAKFYILDNDVLTFKLKPIKNPSVIKSIEFKDDKIIINDIHHLRIVPYKFEILLLEKLC